MAEMEATYWPQSTDFHLLGPVQLLLPLNVSNTDQQWGPHMELFFREASLSVFSTLQEPVVHPHILNDIDSNYGFAFPAQPAPFSGSL